MRKLEISHAEVMRIAIRQEIGCSEESRYDHRLHGLLLVAISAPSSTKNAAAKRAPEIHRTRKGKQWYFGMKVHIGASKQGLVHSVATGPANEADITRLDDVLHGEESKLYGDQAYGW